MDYRNYYKSIVFFIFFLFTLVVPLNQYNMLGQGVNGKAYVASASFVICVLFFIQEYKKAKTKN